MKKAFQTFTSLFLLISGAAILSSFFYKQQDDPAYRFPYEKAGLTKQEAAAHLLSRFSFGARPGDIETVMKTGHETWFHQQLQANLPDLKAEEAVAGYASLKMTNEEIVSTYPRAGQVLRMAIQKGVIDKDSANVDKKEAKDDIKDFMQQAGLKPQAELLRELANQKILRAAYSNNQLKEVLTDFWFNHFNIAASKGGVQQYLTSYERDVIRPNVLGRFETLLLATAKSPAMLTYLDNNKSTVDEEAMNRGQKRLNKIRDGMKEKAEQRMAEKTADTAMANNTAKIKKPKMQGLNENYAREIMELHTMGVEGGYTQSDVTQAARILTGWSLNPAIEYNFKPARQRNEKQLEKLGFVYDDNFFFAANKHDKGEKKVVDVLFPAGGGYEEGVKLIHLLATHSSTAKFIAKKLAVRFVSDAPPQSLLDKMTKTFLEKEGDIKEVLITMVNAPEFWSKNALREKTKSPFEVTISAIRATNANIVAPFQVYQWVSKMGQRLYNYQAPTGFPDRGQYWINTGSLLNRMNFGLAFASNRIPGVKVDLVALNNNREPESAEEALKLYCKILLPERNIEETVKRLTPLLNDPGLQQKVDAAAVKTDSYKAAATEAESEEMMTGNKTKGAKKMGGKKNGTTQVVLAKGNSSMLGQVVGVIIGSPEFQRR